MSAPSPGTSRIHASGIPAPGIPASRIDSAPAIPHSARFRIPHFAFRIALLTLTLLACFVPAASALVVTTTAPPALARMAARIEATDQRPFADALGRAGLGLPDRVHITLIPEDDPHARDTPRWIVGQAYGQSEIQIFPARITAYPLGSLDTVVRHELVHLALNARADGRPLPRWFHEGVAVGVEGGWGATDEIRLIAATRGAPAIAGVTRLFASKDEPDTDRAYLLAAVLVSDLRERHGPTLPGRIAARVANGEPFSRAFAFETGETPDTAAALAWRGYQRWTRWLPAVASATAIWTLILAIAAMAFLSRRHHNARRRRQWEAEEAAIPNATREDPREPPPDLPEDDPRTP